MLFTPEAHEALADESWSAERLLTAITAIVADAEDAFDDGWPAHPRDLLPHEDPATRFGTLYEGGASVVDALHRLARRGVVELRRDAGARVRDARRRSDGAEPVGGRAGPLLALDGRSRHGPLPRRLHRRKRGATAPVGARQSGRGDPPVLIL